MLAHFVSTYLKLFFLLTPFLAASVFITVTNEFTINQKRATALKATLAVLIICFIFYLFGKYIFLAFGITMDTFRIGAGAILFISAVGMVTRPASFQSVKPEDGVAVVPIAMPVMVGPGTIGALLVMGSESGTGTEKIIGIIALVCAILSAGGVLLLAGVIERLMGQKGLVVLSKITGLFVSAIAAQIIFTGISNLFNL
jgi:multiple antibiotic resistance protein